MSARKQTSATTDFNQAVAQSTTLYNTYVAAGEAYKKERNFDALNEDVNIAAKVAGQFPHQSHITNLVITLGESATNATLSAGGAVISRNNSIAGSLVQNTAPIVVSGVANIGHGIVDYTSAYGQHKNTQKLTEAIEQRSAAALGYFQERYDDHVDINTASLAELMATYAYLQNGIMASYLTDKDYQNYVSMKDAVIAKLNMQQTAGLDQNAQHRYQLTIDLMNRNHEESKLWMGTLRDIAKENTVQLNTLLVEMQAQGTKLDNVEAAIHDLPAHIRAMFDEFGIDLKEFFQSRFNVLLAYDKASIEMLTELVSYQRAQQEQQQEMAKQKTIYKSFAFFAMIGSQFDIKPLHHAGVVASASYTIYKSADSLVSTIGNLYGKYGNDITTIVKNFDNFVALLDPALAIGEAVLTIVKLFQKTESVDQIILRQLQQILLRLTALSQQLAQISVELHQHLDYLLSQIRVLFTYNFFLSKKIISKVENVQDTFNYMLNLMDLNFQSIFLQDFFAAMNYSRVYTEHDTAEMMTSRDYLTTMGTFKHWLLSGSKAGLLTGGNIAKALMLSLPNSSTSTAHLDIVSHLFKSIERSPERFNYMVNVFIRYGSDMLISYANSPSGLNNKEVFLRLAHDLSAFANVLPNLEIWHAALQLYLELKLFYCAQEKYDFDVKEQHLISAIGHAETYLKFIHYLQTTPQFIEANAYQISHFVHRIEESYAKHVGALGTSYIFQELNDALAEIHDQQKTKDFLNNDNTRLESAYADKGKVVVSGSGEDKFIHIITNYETNFSRKALFDVLYHKVPRPPAIYVLALQLGLGYFEVVFYESVHGTQGGIDISMDNHRYGAQIYFKAKNGSRYQITEATRDVNGCTWHIAHDNAPQLRAVFDQMVGPRSVLVRVDEPAITQLALEHLHALKRKAVQAFLDEIQKYHWYEQLQCNLAFFIVFAQVIGIPDVVQEKIKNIIHAHPDLREHFNALLYDQNAYVIPRSLKNLQINLLETEAMKAALVAVVNHASLIPNFRKAFFQPYARKELFDGLSIIYNYSVQLRQLLPNRQHSLLQIEGACKTFTQEIAIGPIRDPNLSHKQKIVCASIRPPLSADNIYVFLAGGPEDSDVHYSYYSGGNGSFVKGGKLGSVTDLGLDQSCFSSKLQIDCKDQLFAVMCQNIAVSQNTNYIADCSDQMLSILNREEITPLRVLKESAGFVRSLAFFIDGSNQFLVVAHNSPATISPAIGKINVWNLKTAQCEKSFTAHAGYINSVINFNQWIVTASQDGTIKFWNKKNWVCEITENFSSDADPSVKVTVLTAVTNDRIVAGSNQGFIKVWSVAGISIKVEKSVQAHQQSVTALVELPNKYIASGSRDKTIKIWDITSGTCIKTLEVQKMAEVTALAVLKDGRLVSSFVDGLVLIWNTDTGRNLVAMPGYAVGPALTISQDGQYIICVARDHSINVWHPDLNTNTNLNGQQEGHTDHIYTIIAHSNYQIVSAGADGTIRTWQLKSPIMENVTNHKPVSAQNTASSATLTVSQAAKTGWSWQDAGRWPLLAAPVQSKKIRSQVGNKEPIAAIKGNN